MPQMEDLLKEDPAHRAGRLFPERELQSPTGKAGQTLKLNRHGFESPGVPDSLLHLREGLSSFKFQFPPWQRGDKNIYSEDSKPMTLCSTTVTLRVRFGFGSAASICVNMTFMPSELSCFSLYFRASCRNDSR